MDDVAIREKGEKENRQQARQEVLQVKIKENLDLSKVSQVLDTRALVTLVRWILMSMTLMRKCVIF